MESFYYCLFMLQWRSPEALLLKGGYSEQSGSSGYDLKETGANSLFQAAVGLRGCMKCQYKISGC